MLRQETNVLLEEVRGTEILVVVQFDSCLCPGREAPTRKGETEPLPRVYCLPYKREKFPERFLRRFADMTFRDIEFTAVMEMARKGCN